MFKNNIFWSTILVIGIVLIGLSIWTSDVIDNTPSESPKPLDTESPLPTSTPTPGKSPNVTNVPLPTGDGKTTFVDEKVPWELLLSDASCELKGEIRFIDASTYDNQDALFVYNGVDHPGRNVRWTISPAEPNLEIGPNIFSRMPIPNSQSLLGVFPKGELGAKKYELTAVMEYGRLVDENGKFVTAGGNVKVFEKQCKGKTTIVLP